MALTSFPLLLKLPTETVDEIVSLQEITELIQISRTSKFCHALATRHLYACILLPLAEQLEHFVDAMSSGPQPYQHLKHIKKLSVQLYLSPPPRAAYLPALGWMILQMINLRELQLERPENMLPLLSLLSTVHIPRLRSFTTYFCPASAPYIEPFIALHPALRSLTLRLDSVHIGYNPKAEHFQPFAHLHLPHLEYYDGAAHLLPVVHAPSLRVMHLSWHGPSDVQAILATAAAIAPMVVSFWMRTNYEQGLRIANILSAAKNLCWLHINSDLGATSLSPEEQEEDNMIISIWEGLRCLRFVYFNGFQWMRDSKIVYCPLEPVSMTLTCFLLKLPTETLDEIVSFYKDDLKNLLRISRTSKLCNALAARYLYADAPLTTTKRVRLFVHGMSCGPQPHRHLQCIKNLSVEFLFGPCDAVLTALGGMIAHMINLRKLALNHPRRMPTLIAFLSTAHLPRLQSLTTHFCPVSAPHIGPFIALHPALKSLTLELDIHYTGFNPHAVPPPLIPPPHLPALEDYEGAAHLLPFFHTRSLRIKQLHWYGPTDDVLAIMATAADLAPNQQVLTMDTNHVGAEELTACAIAVYPNVSSLTIFEFNRRMDMERAMRLADCLSTAKHLSQLAIRFLYGFPGRRFRTPLESVSPEQHEEDDRIVSLLSHIHSLRCMMFTGGAIRRTRATVLSDPTVKGYK
ncbi:hypothetical protein B0H16DRAFT_1749733 [Mycena metata]|uniref:F-box domain-containing protein n=1 Tax=Mycena metata TaxID=1033252 RepID=A0AAD7DUZ9_9AGAR|nr:hypothetical protein B0H16DRAFT_1749733 [Mycena metata]